MARKRTDRSINNISLIDEGEGGTSDSTENNPRSWWGGLTRNGRWLIVGVIALVSIGAFGAGMKYLDDTAKAEKKLAVKDRSVISSINPFVPPDPTPQLSKEYIYAGSRLLAVEDANAQAAPPADLAIWRPGTTQGVWWVLNPASGTEWTTVNWGAPGDVPIPGDYDGDGTTDFSVLRPTNNTWYIFYSSIGPASFAYGQAGDLPAQADYDGDGKTDRAVYRPPTGGATNGVWHIQGSSIGYYTQTWGEAGDIPASADYDGDGKADMAIWRSSNSSFYWIGSVSQGAYPAVSIGQSGEPVSSDYDGDGKADFAVYNDSSATWYIRQSTTGTIVTNSWGSPSDIETAVHNDYDGDGKTDLAVWRNSNGYWYIRQSGSNNSPRTVGWGQPGDTPAPAFYRR